MFFPNYKVTIHSLFIFTLHFATHSRLNISEFGLDISPRFLYDSFRSLKRLTVGNCVTAAPTTLTRIV